MKKGDSVNCPTVHNKVPYAVNSSVGEDVVRGLVVDLADVGSCCFPKVYSVIRDTEVNSGLSPVAPMDGVAFGWDDSDGDDDDEDDNDGDDGGDDDNGDWDENGDNNCGVVDDDLFTTARLLADAQAKTQANTVNPRRLNFLSRKIRWLLAVLERRRRVAYMSVHISISLRHRATTYCARSTTYGR